MMIAANYETAVGSVSQCRGMSNMSVQISPKMIYFVRARVHVVVVVVVMVEVNGSWVRGGGEGTGQKAEQDRAVQEKTEQDRA